MQINFTKKSIESISPPAQGRITYRDTKITELELRVSNTGSKVFYLNIEE